MEKTKIVNITKDNIDEHKPRCFMKETDAGYLKKREWLLQRFKEGLVIKQLFVEGVKKCVAYIEYIPGEKAWRSVNAKNFMFIHCVWVTPNKFKKKGYASLLIDECISDSKKEKMSGVAVVASTGPFMASRDLFLKNNFEIADMDENKFELFVKYLKKAKAPSLNHKKSLRDYKGLNIIYSNQCPWVARSIIELTSVAKENGIDVKVKEIKTSKEAQAAPSIYSVFSLIYDGELLVDHYISKTRFQNILNKISKIK